MKMAFDFLTNLIGVSVSVLVVLFVLRTMFPEIYEQFIFRVFGVKPKEKQVVGYE